MKGKNYFMFLTPFLMLSFFMVQSISAQNNPPSRLFVFARGSNASLLYKTFDRTNWGKWETLGGIIQGAPDACSPDIGEVIIFARGQSGPSDGELFYKRTTLG